MTTTVSSSYKQLGLVPLILAGGSGTRFWPRSRRNQAKQVLSLAGKRSLIQQTVDRLEVFVAPAQMWVSTNTAIADTIRKQLPSLQLCQIIEEPLARNTAPSCGLIAFILEQDRPDAIIGIFPSDHVIRDGERFVAAVKAGIQIASVGDNIVVLGVPATKPETGYGYIELGDIADHTVSLSGPVRLVERFTEKPDLMTAKRFVSSGRYSWNSGIFLTTAKTLCAAFREHQPAMSEHLQNIASVYGTDAFCPTFARLYQECESISLDYAVIEPRSHKGAGQNGIVSIPAEFGWDDLGSWDAFHDYLCKEKDPSTDESANAIEGVDPLVLEASGNYVYAPGMQVSLLGVSDLIVVNTADAILITSRDKAQQIGSVVKALADRGMTGYL